MNKYYVQLLKDRNNIYVYAEEIIEFEDKYLLLRNHEVIAMILKSSIEFIHLDED